MTKKNKINKTQCGDPGFVIGVKYNIVWHNRGQKITLKGTFSKICPIHIKIHTQPFIAPKFCVFYSNNKVRVHAQTKKKWSKKYKDEQSTF